MDNGFRYARAYLKGASHFQEHFANATCIIPVSIGQTYHEGEKLALTLQLTNKLFRQCTIMVCDSLQRHTLKWQANCPDITAQKLAKELGRKWFDRHSQIFEKITIAHNVLYWDHWLYSDKYREKYRLLTILYEHDRALRQSIFETIQAFQNRNHLNWSTNVFRSCLSYILEEAAVLFIWAEQGYDFILYPQKYNTAMQFIDENYIRHYNEGSCQFLRISFKRIGTYAKALTD